MCTHAVNSSAHTQTHKRREYQCEAQNKRSLWIWPGFRVRSSLVCAFAASFFFPSFHILLFPPDNLMSTFFSSGIKTLWTSFSAFVLYEAAQWGWETHTTLRRFCVVLPTECPTNYRVQIRSYHSVFFSFLAAVLWFGQCLYQTLFCSPLSLWLSLSLWFQTELVLQMDVDHVVLLALSNDEANIPTATSTTFKLLLWLLRVRCLFCIYSLPRLRAEGWFRNMKTHCNDIGLPLSIGGSLKKSTDDS